MSSISSDGDLVEAFNDLADETRLSIIGQRGEAADFVTDRLGSDMEQAVRTSSCPVKVIHSFIAPSSVSRSFAVCSKNVWKHSLSPRI